MKNMIKKGDILTVKETKSGHSDKGDWSFVRFNGCEKITVWAENNDFKAKIGDSVEVLDIVTVSAKTSKVNDKYYINYNVTALLKNKGGNDVDFDDTENVFDDTGDFI